MSHEGRFEFVRGRVLPSIHPDLADGVIAFVEDQNAPRCLDDFIAAYADCAVVDDQKRRPRRDAVLDGIQFLSGTKVRIDTVCRFSWIPIVDVPLLRPWRPGR